MTHQEAVERSKRALDHRSECHHELIDTGPSERLPGTRRWSCHACHLALYIDPTGVIRDTVPSHFSHSRD